MRELALHILDIITNSIEAQATRVILVIEESAMFNKLRIRIKDNGRGISRKLLGSVYDPFVTTRTTRAVGMGISLFKQAAERCGGEFCIRSRKNIGTIVNASFQMNHIDRSPLGNIEDTLINLIIGSPDIHFVYIHKTDERRFVFDSYWMRARMAEQNKTIYEMAGPAQDHLVAMRHSINSKA